MTNHAESKRQFHVRHLGNGLCLEARISPCVFMHESYPLQIQVTLMRHNGERLGQAHVVDGTKTGATYTDEAVRRLLESIRIVPCPRCSTPAFDPATVQTNRGGLCEMCFLADLKSRCAAAEEAEQQAMVARDRRMKRKGMVVRVTAWVHPEGGGDDYLVDWYLDWQPTHEQVAVQLREEGSIILDDYQIVPL